MKRSPIAKSLTIVAEIALALAFAATATASSKGCSNATLKGTYADQDTGSIMGLGQFVGVNLENFDGNGKLAGSGFSSVNGYTAPGTFAGTYHVNPDCTGTYTVETDQGLTVHAFFVIDDGGNELRIVITDSGTVITCIARRQFPASQLEQ